MNYTTYRLSSEKEREELLKLWNKNREKDLDELLAGFQSVSRWKSEGYWDNDGEQQFYSNWNIRAEM